MLYGLFVAVYLLISLFMLLVIMLQKGRGGIGALGGAQASQVLFGGAGGQEILERATWICGALLMVLSLTLALVKARDAGMSRYLTDTPALVSSPQSTSEESDMSPTDVAAEEVTDTESPEA